MDAHDTILPLSGLTVVEISSLECVSYACVLLHQFGASVTKVEPLQGDPMRRRPPFAPTQAGSQGDYSVAFEFLNAGKVSAIYDGSDIASVAGIQTLLEAADIVVADHQTLQALNLTLPERRVGQLRVFVGLFGGRKEDAAPSSALTRLHAGTSGYIIPADTDISKRPAWPGPYIFECMHGVGLAVAIVAESARQEGGEVDYSLQAYGLWLDKLLFSRTSTSGVEIHRNTAAYPYTGNIPCTDGFVAMLVLEEHQWRGLCRMMGKLEWLSDERFVNGVTRNKNRAPIAAALNDWCASHSVEAVLLAARENDVPTGRCRRPLEVLTSEVAADREFFVERQTPFGVVRVPTLPFGPDWRGQASEPSPKL